MFLEQTRESPTRTRVKICGITREEDALAAAQLGVDAIGLNFYEPSPRYVDVLRAKAIATALPAQVTRVGVFVNARPATVSEAISVVGLDLLQFHGDESRQDCEAYNLPYIKSISVREGTDVSTLVARYPSARGVMLDTWTQDVRGGSGKTFDWSLVPASVALPVILAGGLNAGNVALAIRQIKPFAVDVSGGVERSKGVKDAAKMAAFVEQVNDA